MTPRHQDVQFDVDKIQQGNWEKKSKPQPKPSTKIGPKQKEFFSHYSPCQDILRLQEYKQKKSRKNTHIKVYAPIM